MWPLCLKADPPISHRDPPPRGIRHLAVPAVSAGKEGMERGRAGSVGTALHSQ